MFLFSKTRRVLCTFSTSSRNILIQTSDCTDREVKEAKFPGQIFDKTLIFVQHTRRRKDKYTKTMNLLRRDARTVWELTVHRCLNLSVSHKIKARLRFYCLLVSPWLLPPTTLTHSERGFPPMSRNIQYLFCR